MGSTESAGVYRPRHPERTRFYKLLEGHFEHYLQVHEERFEPRPDPRTGATELRLDVLDWIHAITTQIPDRGLHLVRYYGWYPNRSRGARRADGAARPAGPHADPEPSASPSRATWARLLRRIFEIDPLLCPACGAEMQIVSVIMEPDVIDAILRHLAKTGGRDPFEGRAPIPPRPESGKSFLREPLARGRDAPEG